jgi:hypothetical protein
MTSRDGFESNEHAAAKRIGVAVDDYHGMRARGMRWCSWQRHWVALADMCRSRSRRGGISSVCLACARAKAVRRQERKQTRKHEDAENAEDAAMVERGRALLGPLKPRGEDCAVPDCCYAWSFVAADGARLCATHLRERAKARGATT